MQTRSRVTLFILTAIAVATATAGCVPTSVESSPPPTVSSATPLSTPSPTPTPTNNGLAADVLFRITAIATLPSGAKADLTQTVYQPAPLSAAQEALFVKQCGPGSADGTPLADVQSWLDQSVGITSVSSATLEPGSPRWSALKANELFVGGIGFGAYTGDYKSFQSYCAPGAMTVPGVQTSLGLVPSADPANGAGGWTSTQSYGFGGSRGQGDNLGEGNVTITNCVIQLGSVAAATPVSAAWPAAAAAAGPTKDCYFVAP